MKIRNKLFLILSLLLAFQIPSAANSLFLGNIESVYPDGAINALKNPALVAAQKENMSMGLLLNYQAYLDSESTLSIDFDTIDSESAEASLEESRVGGVDFGYTGKMGGIGIGFGLTGTGDSLYSYRKNKLDINGNDPLSGGALAIESIEEETQVNPAISLSLGWKAGENSFMGIRIISGYSRVTKETESLLTVDTGGASVIIRSNGKETGEAISAQAHLGFFFEDKGNQAGLIIKSGKYDYVKSELEYNDENLTQPEGSVSISSYMQNKEGASLVMGGYAQLLPSLGLAMEGEYRFPAYYREKSFDDSTYQVMERNVENSSGLIVKGGLEFIISPALRFAMGGGFAFFKSSASDSYSSKSESDYKGFYGTAGLVFKMYGGMNFMAGTSLFRIKGKLKDRFSDGTSYSMIDIDTEELNVKAYFGVLYGF